MQETRRTMNTMYATARAMMQDSIGEVWECAAPDKYGNALESGFLVTARGDLNRPIAFVRVWPSDSNALEIDKAELSRAIEAAHDIARNPDGEAMRKAIDLRAYGKGDSAEPMPAWVFGLHCISTERNGETFMQYRQPRPLCRFMLDELIRAACNVFMDADVVRDYPFPIFGLHNGDSGETFLTRDLPNALTQEQRETQAQREPVSVEPVNVEPAKPAVFAADVSAARPSKRKTKRRKGTGHGLRV